MDQRLVANLKLFAGAEDKSEPHDVNYHKIQQISEQLVILAKQATQSSYVGLEEMDRICQFGEVLHKELYHVRNDLIRRKNLELVLPSPNTQHHLPCNSLLSPTSPTPSSPTSQQSMSMANANTANGNLSPSSGSMGGSASPSHGMNLSVDNSSMSIPSTGVMQSDDYWRSRRSPTPLYVNLTEQMILAQSSKRKRPAEGDLFCHNCKTKDTPEWRRGPMGAKTLCNACGIRWRLSQAEAAKQKKGELSPLQLQSPQLQYPPQPQTPQQLMNSPHSLQQQHSIRQQMQQLHQQQQQMQQLQQQYAQSHHHHQHPQQQHMVMPGHVGLAQENIPTRASLSDNNSSSSRSANTNSVISSLSMTPSPIAT